MTNKQFIKVRLKQKLMENEDKFIVGGALIKCTQTGRVFLVLRNDTVPTWALVSGHIEKGESVLEGLKREIREELSIEPDSVSLKFIRIEQVPEKNIEFHFYEGTTSTEFTPTLDQENKKYDWFSKDELPSPLFKGLAEKIKEI